MSGKKNESLENKEMEPHASCVQVQHFKDVFMETPVYFLLISLRDSFFVWVGSAPPCLDHMAVAVPTRFDPQPITSTVLGTPTLASAQQDFTLSVAKHLGKKIGKMFFVSCSLYEYSMELQVFVERRIREALASSA